MPKLGVNIDHIATLRQVRKATYPDPIRAALLAEKAGADQITCHLREDRRHIQDQDLILLKRHLSVPLNLEIAPTAEMVGIALQIRPHRVTFVPERRAEMTTEGGLDLSLDSAKLKEFTADLKDSQVSVSFFIAPDLSHVRQTQSLGADAFEIHTGEYANTDSKKESERILEDIQAAALLGASLQLGVFAGHGLRTCNVLPLVKITEIEEYNIGHSIVADALFLGIEGAVKEMKKALLGGLT